MYKKDGAAWLKHIDFVLLDLLCLALSVYIGLFFDIVGFVYNMYYFYFDLNQY